MRYTMDNGKVVNIPDSEIEKNMKLLEISKQDAIDLWLEDNDFQENEELEELDQKAKKVKIDHGATGGKVSDKKDKKPRTTVVSDQKQMLFSEILTNLQDVFGQNVQVLKENKLITVQIDEKIFKIDVIEQRPPKK